MLYDIRYMFNRVMINIINGIIPHESQYKNIPPDYIDEKRWGAVTMAMAWYKYIKTSPPDHMLYRDTYRYTLNGNTLGMLCIKATKDLYIYDDTLFDWTIDSDGNTEFMLAIKHVPYHKLVKFKTIQYFTNHVNKDGYNYAMLWMERHHSVPPAPLLRFNRNFVTVSGTSYLEMWLKYVETPITKVFIPIDLGLCMISDWVGKYNVLYLFKPLIIDLPKYSIFKIIEQIILKEQRLPPYDLLSLISNKQQTFICNLWHETTQEVPPIEIWPHELFETYDNSILAIKVLEFGYIPKDIDNIKDINIIRQTGNTLAMDYIYKYKEFPPTCIWNKPHIQGKNGNTLAMTWVIKYGTLPPASLLHDARIKNSSGYNIATLWVGKVHTPPPKELVHGFTSYDFTKLVETCIINVKRLSLPSHIRCPSYAHRDDGITFAYLWIEYQRSVPPIWLLHDTNKQIYGQTLAMRWLQIIETEPPEILWHNPDIINRRGRTLAIEWFDKLRRVPPRAVWHSKHMLHGKTLPLDLMNVLEHCADPEFKRRCNVIQTTAFRVGASKFKLITCTMCPYPAMFSIDNTLYCDEHL